MTDAVARARADLEAGRAWKARDRLTGVLSRRQDVDVLDLLATVHHRMGDLPAAGALWFVTGRDDDAAQEAIAAWRERHGSDAQRWYSLPGPVRREVHSSAMQALRAHAGISADGGAAPVTGADSGRWWEPIVFGGGAIVVVVWLLAMIGIGMWTVFWWIWS